MIESQLIQMILAMLGTGITTGAVTVAGIRVHIEYLRKNDESHYQYIRDNHERIEHLERDVVRITGAVERAHARIDESRRRENP